MAPTGGGSLKVAATSSRQSIAAAVFFFVVKPINRLQERRARGEEPEPEAPTEEVQLLTEIRDALHTR